MNDIYEASLSAGRKRTELNARLKNLLSEGLELPITGDQIEDDQPLFGRGLELDSLDTLEIVSLVEEEFGVYITDEDRTVFGSINKIADFIAANSDDD
ncbi:acyl carrier protein [Paenarthrobacter nitroguajacolicus]|uniref:acyl carrier protein n=1 Tax=Paenarthrobacter nitroguajacolicus TaxID=211146 RepID=UPI0006D11897|nr:phosphopantetheine-binding protein [Paenarthrobacter nitroguajacolicus]